MFVFPNLNGILPFIFQNTMISTFHEQNDPIYRENEKTLTER